MVVGAAVSASFLVEDDVVAGGDIVDRIDRRREFVVAGWVERVIDLACCLLIFLLDVEAFLDGDWEYVCFHLTLVASFDGTPVVVAFEVAFGWTIPDENDDFFANPLPTPFTLSL